MKFNSKKAEIYVPDGSDEKSALSRTKYLCVAAHQDDIEIMAYAQIAECIKLGGNLFTGVCVADGAGSPRTGEFADFTNEEMMLERVKEQKEASKLGKYSAQILLGYSSSEIKDGKNTDTVQDIAAIIKECRPKTVFTHNVADKHDTHVGVALRVIEAIRSLEACDRPEKVYSLEVWRGLDWLPDEIKATFDASYDEQLAKDLLNCHRSQTAGGKRYDLASVGRRRANATFFASHAVDNADMLCYGLDITELAFGNESPEDFILSYIDRFKNEVSSTVRKLM